MIILAWVWFAIVQLVSLVAMVAGYILLIAPCLLHSWEPALSTVGPTQQSDRWSWPINAVYGNPEDGVSGQYAKVWVLPNKQEPFMPDASPAWRAYVWSAVRNSADGLKYVFAWSKGPLVIHEYFLFGKPRTFKAGWQAENGIKVPVLSIG